VRTFCLIMRTTRTACALAGRCRGNSRTIRRSPGLLGQAGNRVRHPRVGVRSRAGQAGADRAQGHGWLPARPGEWRGAGRAA
jgi:hypothetical protein